MFLLSPTVKKNLHAYAIEIGFVALGVTEPSQPKSYHRYLDWLTKGYAGSMWYMSEETRKQKRGDVKLLLPNTQSVIVGAISYKPREELSQNDVKIARYAWGKDYHVVLKDKLHQLVLWLNRNVDSHEFKVCVDTAPILERDFAQASGLGWIGKNTCLINSKHGSYICLGEILTSLKIEPDQPASFHCGTCTRCLDACPTQAFDAPFVLNAQKCISYHTIENRDPEIPGDISGKNEEWIAGCDICQEVCPWNRKSPSLTLEEFKPLHHMSLSKSDILESSSSEIREMFKDTSLSRIKPEQMKRNIASLKN